MKYAITGLMIGLLLTACATAPSNGLIVPDVVEYSRDQQNTAADELERNSVPMLAEFMKDCKVMRDQARAALRRLGGG